VSDSINSVPTERGAVNRRQFLRAVSLGVSSAAVTRVAARESSSPTTDTVGCKSFPKFAGMPGESPVNSYNRPYDAGTSRGMPTTGTATPTPTPTPTSAVATPTSAWEPTGSVAVPGATETVLTPDGETAFAATGDGFAAVDLSDPADPVVLTRETGISPPRADAVMADVFDVKYDDGRLLVAGPANYHPDAFRGVALFDVADPTDPTLLSGYRTTFPVHNCYLDGNYAYLTGNDGETNPLVVVDVVNVREVARWSVVDHDERWREVDVGLWPLHDVFVQDGMAFLAYWDAGTWLLDVSDPADPQYVADVREQSLDSLADLEGLRSARRSAEPPGNDHYVATDDARQLLAVGKETWNSNFGKDETTPGPDDPGGPSGIAIYTISDPTDPVYRATIDPPPTADPNVNGVWTTAHNFEVAGDYLYSSWYRGGVKVHDVSDPANPREVRHFRRSSTTGFWTAQLAVPGETVVATSHENARQPDDSGVVYTFPDVPRPTPTSSPPATRSLTATPSSTDQRGRSPTDTSTRAPTPTATDDTPATSDASGPGFGPLAALAALGVGAWRLGRGGGSDGDREDT
jgi:hypothetical protein